MRKINLLIGFFLCFSLFFIFPKSIVIKASTPFPKGHIITDAMEDFKARIEEVTKGRIVIEIQMGTDSEEKVNEKCSQGIFDMQFTGGRALEVFAPEYFFINAPFVIKDYKHFYRVMNGPLGEKAKKLILEKGNMLTIGNIYRGYRQMTSNRPINGLADIKDLKLRLPVVPTWVKIWEALGAKAVPVPLPELYNSLKEGKADASEGDLTQISGYKLNEVQGYLIITNHLASFGWVHFYKPTFDKLTKNDQKLVLDLVKQACDAATDKLLKNEEKILKDLANAGMKVITLDEKAMQEIREKAAPAVEELFKTTWPVTTWKEVLAQ